MCGSKKSRFIKEQEASGILEDLGKGIIAAVVFFGETVDKTFASSIKTLNLMIDKDLYNLNLQ